MQTSRFFRSGKIPIQRIPFAFGKYRETHTPKEESVVVPCLAVTAVLIGGIIWLGVIGDKRVLAKREESKYIKTALKHIR